MLIGKQIGPYRILSNNALYTAGPCYKAVHLEQRDIFTLIFLRSPFQKEKPLEQDFLKKLHLATALNHSNIARLFLPENHGNFSLLPMEFVHGRSASDMIATGASSFDFTLELAIQATRGLMEIHEIGLVHGRLTSQSVLFLEARQVKLIDLVLPFLPRESDPYKLVEFKEQSSIDLPLQPPLLNLSYRAPEQVHGKPANAQTDLFSLGVVLYELSLGEFLFWDGSLPSLNQQILERELPQLVTVSPQTSPGWSRVLGALLEKDPENRYPSAYDLLCDLEKLNYGFSLDRLAYRPANPRLTRRGFFKSFTGEPTG